MTLGKVPYAWGLCRVPRDEIPEQKTDAHISGVWYTIARKELGNGNWEMVLLLLAAREGTSGTDLCRFFGTSGTDLCPIQIGKTLIDGGHGFMR